MGMCDENGIGIPIDDLILPIFTAVNDDFVVIVSNLKRTMSFMVAGGRFKIAACTQESQLHYIFKYSFFCLERLLVMI